MNITVEKQPNCQASLQVEVPSEAVDSERSRIIAAYSSQARIPGFRPGKAPRKVIEKRFKDSIDEELRDRLTRQAFDEALKQESLKVLNFGVPDRFEANPDGTISIHSTLVLAPEFELPEYKGLSVESAPTEVSDEEVDQNLQSLRERFADYEDITDRPAGSGDLAVVDFTSTLEGKPLEEALGKPAGYLSGREGFWVKLDEQSFLPGFAAKLEGANPGDSLEFDLALPDDFPMADLQGRELGFQVQVKELKTAVLPELDDAFAAKVAGDRSLDELRELVRAQLEQEKQRKSDDHKVSQIVEHFNGLVDFELPEQLVQQETQSQADGMVERGVRSGMSEEELQAQQTEIFAAAGMQARTNLKTNFILQEIARAEGLEVSDQELVGHLAQIAQSRKEPPKKFIKQMQKEGRISGIRNSMLVGKAIDFILEHAKVGEVPAGDDSSDE